MKCLILAAGYATRLYPLTKDRPKPLLRVGDRAILDWLVDDIDRSGAVDGYIVISNHRFADAFMDWAARKPQRITVVDDGTCTNETRLGAVRDIRFAIDALQLDDDMLVIAGDNVLDFSLIRFIDYALSRRASCVMRYREEDAGRLRRTGVAEIGPDDRVLGMEEKPAEPKSHWCIPPFYFYCRADARRVKAGIEAGCGTDAPGSFIAWLARQVPVYAMEMPGRRYDIGDPESYAAVRDSYRGIGG
ncbi:MAG: nucleotidyltransferase family protein [Clostridia bacterium]|nr:nucleotidyltransferase family protein [Clostridia bacterium]